MWGGGAGCDPLSGLSGQSLELSNTHLLPQLPNPDPETPSTP